MASVSGHGNNNLSVLISQRLSDTSDRGITSGVLGNRTILVAGGDSLQELPYEDARAMLEVPCCCKQRAASGR